MDELARAAFETRDLDAELASLTADSEFDAVELVRSVAVEPRMVSFETDELTVELQLDRRGAAVAVRGLVIGAVTRVELETGSARTEAGLDEQGWFFVESVPAGALRLRLTTPGGGHVTTEWITT